MKNTPRPRWPSGAVLAFAAAAVTAGCSAQGASPSDLDTRSLAADNAALQKQLASMAPTLMVQAGQLAPPAPGAQPTGWDNAESIRGGIRLFATYDSSGPDAWDVRAYPLVYITSEGVGSNPKGGTRKSGVQVIDAYGKLDRVLEGPRADWFHHITGFTDWQGRDRVIFDRLTIARIVSPGLMGTGDQRRNKTHSSRPSWA